MIAISINDLTLRFGTTTILEKVSFSLEENDKLGIIGVNGSGKSSLFKLILGEYEAEEGNVYISKGKSVGVLTQEGAFTVSDLCGDTALSRCTRLSRNCFAWKPVLPSWRHRCLHKRGEILL